MSMPGIAHGHLAGLREVALRVADLGFERVEADGLALGHGFRTHLAAVLYPHILPGFG